jgi:hypothetical protein
MSDAVTERPIIFSAAMARAILASDKTQTRRVVKGAPVGPDSYVLGIYKGVWGIHANLDAPAAFRARCPYGEAGTRLWVRETCRAVERPDGQDGVAYAADDAFVPIDDTHEAAKAWIKLNAYRGQEGTTVPAIHMPRWASRITLEVTDVRIERLHQLTALDAFAEGIQGAGDGGFQSDAAGHHYSADPVEAFAGLWESLTGPHGYGWDANPFCWIVNFRRLEN